MHGSLGKLRKCVSEGERLASIKHNPWSQNYVHSTLPHAARGIMIRVRLLVGCRLTVIIYSLQKYCRIGRIHDGAPRNANYISSGKVCPPTMIFQNKTPITWYPKISRAIYLYF